MFSDYHHELSAILRTFQNQQHLVAACGEMDYLTERERNILYALVMKEIDSLIWPTNNPVGGSGLTEPVPKASVHVSPNRRAMYVDPHLYLGRDLK